MLRCNNIFLAHGDLLAICMRSSCLRLFNKQSLAGCSMLGVYSEYRAGGESILCAAQKIVAKRICALQYKV